MNVTFCIIIGLPDITGISLVVSGLLLILKIGRYYYFNKVIVFISILFLVLNR